MKLHSSISMIFGLLAVSTWAAPENNGTVFDGGWRLRLGAVFDSGVKCKMNLTPHPVYSSPFRNAPGKGMSREDAEKAAWGETGDDGRTVFYNADKDATSWFGPDPDVEPGVGEDYGRTKNYSFAQSVWTPKTDRFTLGDVTYGAVVNEQVTLASAVEAYDRDDSALPGVTAELSRNLFHDQDIGWGIDLGFGVNYFRRNDAFSAKTDWVNGSSDLQQQRLYSTYEEKDAGWTELLNDKEFGSFIWHDGFIGGGIAHPVDMGEDSGYFTKGEGKGKIIDSDTSYGTMRVNGDYSNLELILQAHPYYDVFDWLRLNSTLGVVVSRQAIDLRTSVLRDGAIAERRTREFKEWDVYGIAGLGAMFYYNDFTLSFDFLARFLDDSMSVRTPEVNGKVERGDWMFQLSLGYEF